MEFELYSFDTCKYMGKNNGFFTKGKEYGIVDVGTCAWANDVNGFGVFLTTDKYVGDDVDECMFYSWKCFNQNFIHSIQVNTKKRAKRRYTDYVKNEKKIDVYKNKIGREDIENFLEENGITKLLKMKINWCCSYDLSKRGEKHSNKKRELTLLEELKAFNPVYLESNLNIFDEELDDTDFSIPLNNVAFELS